MTDPRAIRLLLVEDDPGDQLLIRQVIESSTVPVQCVTVSDGGEALDYLSGSIGSDDTRPDLVLLDLNLPRISGWEVLRRIRKDDALCELPVVILSTSSWARDVRGAYRLGANSYVSKPVTFEEFERLGQLLCDYWFALALLPSGG